MDGVRHFLGLSPSESDATRVLVCWRRFQQRRVAAEDDRWNAVAAQGCWTERKTKGHQRPRRSQDHSSDELRGCEWSESRWGVCNADGLRRYPRRRGENLFSSNSVDFTKFELKTPAAAISSLEQRTHSMTRHGIAPATRLMDPKKR